MSEIEFVERFLPGHCSYAEFLLVGIVEKQNRAEDCRLSHALCADEVHVAVETDLGIAYIGTIDKDYFIQVSHRQPPH